MNRLINACILCCCFITALSACAVDNTLPDKVQKNPANPLVRLSTNFGDIVLELYPDKAPVTVNNFLGYINSYHYDGIIFHRVVKNFVIQAGGYGFDLYPRQPGEPIINESDNGLANKPGSIAMARTAHPDSARAQFYINLGNNKNLNATSAKLGYTVFGQVIKGMDVVQAIGRQPVKRAGTHQHLPKQPIMIQKARLEKPNETNEVKENAK